MTKPIRRSEITAKAVRPGRAHAVPAAETAGVRGEAAAAAAPAVQKDIFEKAIERFHARDFQEARRLFEQAAGGPSMEMGHSARLHIRMCEQRIAAGSPNLGSVEDYYNYAVALINRKEFAEAERQLREALRLGPDADHVHYALALSCGLQGDMTEAQASLKRAIELQPRNRIAARNDPDFHELVHQPPLRDLVFPEKASSV